MHHSPGDAVAAGSPPVHLAILGPTGSGKSALAMAIAQALHGEIISCDSMQVYRGLDIGTAKPTSDERLSVRHHLLDTHDLAEPYNANIFLQLAKPIIAKMSQYDTPVVLAGGTGMYAKSLIYGLDLLPADAALAASIWAICGSPSGVESLIQELAAASPQLAEKCRENTRRLARAVEVLRLSGFAPDHPHWKSAAINGMTDDSTKWIQIVLMPHPDVHREALIQRTDSMLNAGWLDETRHLMTLGLADSPTARQALGYREIIVYLNGGGGSIQDLRSAIINRTWSYVRRQRTWFRHQHPGALQIPYFMSDFSYLSQKLAAALGKARQEGVDYRQVIHSLSVVNS